MAPRANSATDCLRLVCPSGRGCLPLRSALVAPRLRALSEPALLPFSTSSLLPSRKHITQYSSIRTRADRAGRGRGTGFASACVGPAAKWANARWYLDTLITTLRRALVAAWWDKLAERRPLGVHHIRPLSLRDGHRPGNQWRLASRRHVSRAAASRLPSPSPRLFPGFQSPSTGPPQPWRSALAPSLATPPAGLAPSSPSLWQNGRNANRRSPPLTASWTVIRSGDPRPSCGRRCAGRKGRGTDGFLLARLCRVLCQSRVFCPRPARRATLADEVGRGRDPRPGYSQIGPADSTRRSIPTSRSAGPARSIYGNYFCPVSVFLRTSEPSVGDGQAARPHRPHSSPDPVPYGLPSGGGGLFWRVEWNPSTRATLDRLFSWPCAFPAHRSRGCTQATGAGKVFPSVLGRSKSRLELPDVMARTTVTSTAVGGVKVCWASSPTFLGLRGAGSFWPCCPSSPGTLPGTSVYLVRSGNLDGLGSIWPLPGL